ncbi:hypothetical protein [Streptomyces sp. NPDC005828]|uniref:hypothetical protein n=1 Tax=Streptomyces sp. NPDC005828 TaxID=3157071 RepID=UPI0033C66946
MLTQQFDTGPVTVGTDIGITMDKLHAVLADTAPHSTAPQAVRADAAPAPAWWNDIFGDTRVTLKSEPPTAGVDLHQTLALRGTVTAEQTIEGGLAEVAAAARTHLGTYLAVIAI